VLSDVKGIFEYAHFINLEYHPMTCAITVFVDHEPYNNVSKSLYASSEHCKLPIRN